MVQQTWVLFLVLWCESRKKKQAHSEGHDIPKQKRKGGLQIPVCLPEKVAGKQPLYFPAISQDWGRIPEVCFLGPFTLLSKMDSESLQREVAALTTSPSPVAACSELGVGQALLYPRAHNSACKRPQHSGEILTVSSSSAGMIAA